MEQEEACGLWEVGVYCISLSHMRKKIQSNLGNREGI